MKYDYLIVGCGFAGCTLAERLANVLDKKVLIVDRRDHAGGNCYDYINEYGIFVQKYGPHIFHTKNEEVWRYLSHFTEWNDYVHRVIANIGGREVYFPINIETMETLKQRKFTSDTLKEYFREKRAKIDEIKNSKDVVLSQVGEEIYELFVKYYTKKQWGVMPEELDSEVLKRIPVRFNRDTRYFDDPWQGIPKNGFNRIFSKMLSSENIEVKLNTDYRDIIDQVEYEKLIYTGKLDSFFDNKYGKLPYRCINFEFKTLDQEYFQKNSVINYTCDKEYTRITEFKYFYFQKNPRTTICYEFPSDRGLPSYPVPMKSNRILYEKYKKEAEKTDNTFFTGRLALYKYMNMDKVIEESLNLFEKLRTITEREK